MRTDLEGNLGGQSVAVVDNGRAVISIPAIQLHTPATRQQHLEYSETEDIQYIQTDIPSAKPRIQRQYTTYTHRQPVRHKIMVQSHDRLFASAY